MASLVAYSGSESDEASEEETQRENRSGAPQSQTKFDVNKPSLPLGSKKPSPFSAAGVDVTTLPTDSDNALHSQVRDKNEIISEKGDYFGLDAENSEDSGDGDTQLYFVKANNVWSKPICNSSSEMTSVAKSELEVPNKDSEHANVLDLAQRDSSLRFHLPRSEFWSGKRKSEDWSRPEQIWKISSNDKHRLSEKSTPISETTSYSDKKTQIDRTHHAQEEAVTLSKNCFYIHHRISPALHQTLPCRPPTHKYLSLTGHVGTVNRVKWAKSDFSHLLASASMDNTVKIWNVFSNLSHCIQTFCSHTKAVKDITWSPLGKEMLSCGYDRTARLNDVIKGMEIAKFEHQDFLTCVKYHPINPNYIMVGSKDVVLCWDIRCPATCVKTFSYKHNFGQVQDLIFIRDGHEFVISTDIVTRDSADRSIMVFDFSSRVVLSNQVYQERYMCPRLAAHPHQAEMMAQSCGNYLSLFSTIKPYKMNRCKRFEGHKVLGYAVGCGYSSDGRLVVSGSSDSKVIIWDYQRAIQLKQLGDPHEIYLDVAWHPLLNSTVASSTWGGRIDIWQ